MKRFREEIKSLTDRKEEGEAGEAWVLVFTSPHPNNSTMCCFHLIPYPVYGVWVGGCVCKWVCGGGCGSTKRSTSNRLKLLHADVDV